MISQLFFTNKTIWDKDEKKKKKGERERRKDMSNIPGEHEVLAHEATLTRIASFDELLGAAILLVIGVAR